MDLFGQTNLSGSEALDDNLVESLKSTQGDLPIRANVESRYFENESMENTFQRLKGRKAFDRRFNHWRYPPCPLAETWIHALLSGSPAFPDRAVNHAVLALLSQPRRLSN